MTPHDRRDPRWLWRVRYRELSRSTQSPPVSEFHDCPSAQLELPFAQMHASIDMQNLAGHLAGFGEIEHGLGNVLGCGYGSKRRERAQELLGNALEKWRGYHSWSYRVHTNSLLRVLHREATGDCVDAAFGNHWHRRGERRERMIGDGGRDTHDAAVQVGGGQRAKVLSRIIQKRLWKKYAGIVHQSIDRTESLKSCLDYMLCRRRLADVAVDQSQMVRFLKLFLAADMTRSSHHVVATVKEQGRDAGTDSLRGSGHNDGLLFHSHDGSSALSCDLSIAGLISSKLLWSHTPRLIR